MFTEVTIRTTGISIPTVFITFPSGVTVARTESQARRQCWVSTWHDMVSLSSVVCSTYQLPSDVEPLLFSQGISSIMVSA